jgi:hypothetical protein
MAAAGYSDNGRDRDCGARQGFKILVAFHGGLLVLMALIMKPAAPGCQFFGGKFKKSLILTELRGAADQ